MGSLDVVGVWETEGESDGCLVEECTLDGMLDGISDRTELVGAIVVVVFDVGETVELGDVDPNVGDDGLALGGTCSSSCWMLVEGTGDLLLTDGTTDEVPMEGLSRFEGFVD